MCTVLRLSNGSKASVVLLKWTLCAGQLKPMLRTQFERVDKPLSTACKPQMLSSRLYSREGVLWFSSLTAEHPSSLLVLHESHELLLEKLYLLILVRQVV